MPRNSRRTLSHLAAPLAAAALLFLTPPGRAQTAIQATVFIAQEAMQEIANKVAAIKLAELNANTADNVRKMIGEARKDFVKGMTDLDQQIATLEVNKDKNADLLAELKKAKAHGQQAEAKLKDLQARMADNDKMKASLGSGFLVRTLREVAQSMGQAGKTVAAADATLSSTSDDKAGFVEIRELTISKGAMKFYVTDFVPGKGFVEKEIFAGNKIAIRKLPVVIRAAVQEDNKKRLTEQQAKNDGKTVVFEDVDGTPGNKFAYGNKMATSLWTAKEEYTWKADLSVAANKKLRGLSQLNSDIATKAKTGDRAQISPTESVAQNLTFDVEGKSLGWKLVSVRNGVERTEEIAPKNGNAKARIVISIFPAGQ